ncbi:hypothetical protein [Rugamonas aquatica]|uniref:Uncharacterized protein n=1 Tax=Rugamonas aquatica TaxID=2743357 RepID=A0A6A7N4I9_9BURK|nr:hypothetical protein [Rugamonas aquatica]MQA39983.1 hypothetical protein [Rugamonas aquatica]
MSEKKPLHDEAQFLIVQQHQLNAAGTHLGAMSAALDQLQGAQQRNDALLDQLLAQADAMAGGDQVFIEYDIEIDVLMEVDELEVSASVQPLGMLDSVQIDRDADWAFCLQAMDEYGGRNKLEASEDPFRHLMSDSQRIALEKRIRDEFSLKGADCDKYDYMIAGTCGLIGGLVDIFFIGLPGEGPLGKLADDATDAMVEKFAGLMGWQGPRNPDNATASAIGFLERKFRVNYDQATGAAVDDAFTMSTKNHHVKNLAHSPDLIGLFFSVLNQFTSTSSFISDGRLITIDTETFELQGSNLVSKIFSGFVNWLGHLFSDMAGSSGAVGRGSGIPMPFYSLLQLINVGEFGQHRQTFGTVAVRVFEQGYDLRHGLALAIPVLITELLTRMMWTVKQAFFHKRPLLQCLPSAANPELRRMLMIGHGTLCIFDAADAGIRSGGDIVQFLLRSNLVAWARFGTLALKEIRVWYGEGSMDVDAVDDYLDREYARMLA